MSFGGSRGRRNFLQTVSVQSTRATALHLLEIIAAFDISHKQKAFEGLHVRACRDHVHGDSNSRIIAIAKLSKDGLWVFGRLICDLLAEVIALCEFFPDDLNNVVGVTVGLGKNECLRCFRTSGEDVGEFIPEGSHDRAYLIGIDDASVELRGRVLLFFVLTFPPPLTSSAFALFDLLIYFDLAALDLAPKFYPVLSSPLPLDLPCWAVEATGAGAEPSA